MSKSLLTDTLAYQLGVRPALQFRDMSKAPLRKVVLQLNSFMELDDAYEWLGGGSSFKEPPRGDPQKDAVVFYMLHHAISCIRKTYNPLEPLPAHVLKVCDRYHEQLALRGTRMFYYLLLICVRESRHSSGVKGGFGPVLRAKYTDSVVDFHAKVEDLSETAAVDLFKANPPDVPLGLWVGFMADQFRDYHYGHALGGEKWAKIADLVRDFVSGKISLELMLDTAFTLNHNTSPAFDKGMLYTHYTADLLKVLDVQNSGQIPQLVAEGGVPQANTVDVKSLFEQCKIAAGDEFCQKPYVNWYKVEEDFQALSEEKKKGHSANYPAEKAKQAKLYGVPDGTKAKVTVAEVIAKKAQEAKDSGVLALVTIFPGMGGHPAQCIQKIARKDL